MNTDEAILPYIGSEMAFPAISAPVCQGAVRIHAADKRTAGVSTAASKPICLPIDVMKAVYRFQQLRLPPLYVYF
jgi:hypothetical protein